MIDITLSCGRTFIIDDGDADILLGHNWHIDKRGRTFYVRGRLPGEQAGGVYLHNLIIGGMADHRDGDGLNNRRQNLRPCTQQQNNLNRSAKRGKRFKGVYKQKCRGFYAQVCLNGKVRSSGGHATEEDAARAYDEMAIELHGEFARLNFPRDSETDVGVDAGHLLGAAP